MSVFIGEAVIALAGLYLLTLSVLAVRWPVRLRHFLYAHASSAKAHVLEMGARIVVGSALVWSAPHMRYPLAFGVFGWVLIATSAVLCLLPWRLHQRFAQRVLPVVSDRPLLLALGALVGGLALLVGLFGGPGDSIAHATGR